LERVSKQIHLLDHFRGKQKGLRQLECGQEASNSLEGVLPSEGVVPPRKGWTVRVVILVMAVVMMSVEGVVLILRVGIASSRSIPRRGGMVSSSRRWEIFQAALAAAARRIRLGQASAIARPLSVTTGRLVLLFGSEDATWIGEAKACKYHCEE